MLSSTAFVLMEALRHLGLSGIELARAQVNMIRLMLFKLTARLKTSVRCVVFHLASSYPYRSALIHALVVIRFVPINSTIFR